MGYEHGACLAALFRQPNVVGLSPVHLLGAVATRLVLVMSKRNARSFIAGPDDTKKPGAIQFVTRDGDGGPVVGINHACPCGCGKRSFIRLNPEFWGPGTVPMWTRTGDDLHMTLSPSIGIKPQDAAGAYHWHGYLRDGVFEEC